MSLIHWLALKVDRVHKQTVSRFFVSRPYGTFILRRIRHRVFFAINELGREFGAIKMLICNIPELSLAQ